jgi:putative ATP-dependent endonuclease of OLD family
LYLKSVTVHGFRAANEHPLECELPGRFSVLLGANSAGKSTIVDSIVMSHRDVFPGTPRPSAAVLSKSIPTRTIDISYALEDPDTSPLGLLCDSTVRVPEWTTTLSRSMGRVAASQGDAPGDGLLPILYLSPTRNPALDLAGREARLIVELLRSQAYRDKGDKSLKDLRGLLGGVVGSVVSKWPVNAAEARVASTLAELTDGVAGRVPYLGTTSIDDSFLARVFEFLIGAAGVPRADSHRLETEGLGYANLLQLALVLAAIPDLTAAPELADGAEDDIDDEGEDAHGQEDEDGAADDGDLHEVPDERTDDDRRAQMDEADERSEMDDDTFFAGTFHAVVVLEEPEAHLHPQLQHGLVAYLKEVVERRPEVQVILTTHSDEIVAACEPEDLVVLRRDEVGRPAARTIKSFDLSETKLAQARRHLDVNRSASLFADRAVLVEGITDAIVLRAVARVWAGEDRIKRRFVDALSISVVGSRVGSWLPSMLARPGEEIVDRLAVLRDTDDRAEPQWVTDKRNDHFDVFYSDPTLEPSITSGNEDLVRDGLVALGVDEGSIPHDDSELPAWVENWFKKRGKTRKARFADEFAASCDTDPEGVLIPEQFGDLLEFVWNGFLVEAEDLEAGDEDDAVGADE